MSDLFVSLRRWNVRLESGSRSIVALAGGFYYRHAIISSRDIFKNREDIEPSNGRCQCLPEISLRYATRPTRKISLRYFRGTLSKLASL